MDLVSALKKQIQYCETYERYKCGVFVKTDKQRDIAVKCILNLLSISESKWCRYEHSKVNVYWNKKGSSITVISINNPARTSRLNGVIIETEINEETISSVISPHLIPMYEFRNHTTETFKDAAKRILAVNIRVGDIAKSYALVTD